MELSKHFTISTDYKEFRTLANWEMLKFAEVLIIDNTEINSHPLLYQLNGACSSFDQLLDVYHTKQGFQSRDAFTLVGEVCQIDKKKKQISLTNHHIVAYSYLVIASGKKAFSSFNHEELIAALHPLINGLKIKMNIPPHFSNVDLKICCAPLKKALPSIMSEHMPQIHEKNSIAKIAPQHILKTETHIKQVTINTHINRFYEVQI